MCSASLVEQVDRARLAVARIAGLDFFHLGLAMAIQLWILGSMNQTQDTMKQFSKEQFFNGIEDFNMTGARQTGDVMPSSRETKFSGRECSTNWRCQKTRKLYGKCVSDTYGIKPTSYFLVI